MMKYILFLILILVSIILVCFSLYNYSTRYSDTPDKEPYSFLNQFPYELQSDETTKHHFIVRILAAIFGGVFSIYGLYTFFYLNRYGAKIPLDYIIGIVFLISGISMFLLFIYTLKDYKKHLITTSILFSSTVVSYLLIGLFVIVDPRNTYHISLMYISFIIGIITLISLFVLPLKKWMYLEKQEKNGMVSYHRKKVAILPLVEWIFIGLNLLLATILIFY